MTTFNMESIFTHKLKQSWTSAGNLRYSAANNWDSVSGTHWNRCIRWHWQGNDQHRYSTNPRRIQMPYHSVAKSDPNSKLLLCKWKTTATHKNTKWYHLRWWSSHKYDSGLPTGRSVVQCSVHQISECTEIFAITCDTYRIQAQLSLGPSFLNIRTWAQMSYTDAGLIDNWAYVR